MSSEIAHMCCHCGIVFSSESELFLHVGAQHISFHEANQFAGTTGILDGTETYIAPDSPQIITIKEEELSDDGEARVHKAKRLKKDSKKEVPKKEKTIISLNGPFKCMQTVDNSDFEPCSMVFDNCCQYTKHFLEVHQKRSQARCLVCERKLNQVDEIGPPDMNQTYTCSICSQIFLDQLSHDEHYGNHIKVKPYECNKCPKKFSQQSGLIQHERLHTGERPYQCAYCDKRFRQKSGLEQHTRIHLNYRPFECVVCSKQFTQSAHLRQHMRTHTNMKPFGCETCGAKFKQVAQLNNHIRHKHEANLPVSVSAEDIEVDVVDHDYCQL